MTGPSDREFETRNASRANRPHRTLKTDKDGRVSHRFACSCANRKARSESKRPTSSSIAAGCMEAAWMGGGGIPAIGESAVRSR